MSAKFQEPYLLIDVYHKTAYIRDLYSWEEIELIYSDSLEDIKCQLLFYTFKISNLWYTSFSNYGIITYNLQYL